MDLPRTLGRVLRRLSKARNGDEKRHRYHYQKVESVFLRRGLMEPADLWRDILLVADLRPTDRVLDMGCAEGHISMEIAKHVAHVNGVELDAFRVEEARRLADKHKVENVSFAAGSVVDYPIETCSYDVVLLLAVLGKKTETGHVGLKELERLLIATRRQIVVRLGVQKHSTVQRAISLPEILAKMHECGFDGICFARKDRYGNLIIGNRRDTDARLGVVPPLVLVPAEHLQSHPCLRNATIGLLRDFP